MLHKDLLDPKRKLLLLIKIPIKYFIDVISVALILHG